MIQQKEVPLNIKKQEAIIVKEREVEEARLIAEKETVERNKLAELAKIDKQKELEIAQANEGIQKANATASKYEAMAIKETGFAEAEVSKAKFAAKQVNKEIYLAELKLEETKAVAEVLPHIKLDSPDTVIMGQGNGSNNISDLLNVKLVQDVVGK